MKIGCEIFYKTDGFPIAFVGDWIERRPDVSNAASVLKEDCFYYGICVSLLGKAIVTVAGILTIRCNPNLKAVEQLPAHAAA